MATKKQPVVAMDYPAHEATYGGFLSLVKWGIVTLAIMVIALYVLINP